MRKILALILTLGIIIMLCVSISASDGTGEYISDVYSDLTSEVQTEHASEEDSIDSTQLSTEQISDIVDVVQNSESEYEAIVKIAEIFGCSLSDAEQILSSIVVFGDQHFNDTAAWSLLKKEITQNWYFWTVVALAGITVVTVVVGVIVMMIRILPDNKKTKRGVMEYKNGIENTIASANETLENIKKQNQESREVCQRLCTELSNKSIKIVELEEKVVAVERSALAAEQAVYESTLYALEILYLISKRMALPISDKSVIDMWYAHATEQLKSQMNEATREAVEETSTIILPREEQDNVTDSGDS